jgi:hypothetical protein
MSIADYTDLLVQTSEYTGRDDFAHMFPRFVKFAENKLNRVLRVGSMEVIDTFTTAANGEVALPADFLEMREFLDPNGYPIELTSMPAANWQYGAFDGGTATTYYIIGSSLYVLPQQGGDFTATYYSKIPALTPAASSNWLLEEAPLIYLYAVIAETIGWAVAAGKETDVGKAKAASDMLAFEVSQFQRSDLNKRYANAKMTTRGVNP